MTVGDLMTSLVWIAVAVCAGVVSYGVFWRIIELIFPTVYGDLPHEGLCLHMSEFARRGLRGCQLVIEDVASGSTVRVVKTYERRGDGDVHLWAIPVGVAVGDVRVASIDASLATLQVRCVVGVQGYRRFRRCVACDCGDDVAVLDQVVRNMFRCSPLVSGPKVFRVRVAGTISDLDLPVPISGRTTIRQMLLFRHACRKGLPYKQWQRASIGLRIGELVGGVLRGVIDMLSLLGGKRRM
jgi:hypothetical protein